MLGSPLAQCLSKGERSIPRQRLTEPEDLLHEVQREFSSELQESDEDAVGDPRIVEGAVCRRKHYAQFLPQRAKVVSPRIWQQDRGQFVCVNDLVVPRCQVTAQESQVKAYVVPQNGSVADEALHIACDLGEARCVPKHGIVDTGQPGNELWHVPPGVDK